MKHILLRLQLPYGTVKLSHYRLLLQHDFNPNTGLRAVPKLTEKHVHPNNFQKMSVRLAAQVTGQSCRRLDALMQLCCCFCGLCRQHC
jgi:hypothetical protein